MICYFFIKFLYFSCLAKFAIKFINNKCNIVSKKEDRLEELNLKKELDAHNSILLHMHFSHYNKDIVKITKELADNNKVCYVTLNKSYENLRQIFEKNNIKLENIKFIDAITRTFKKVDDTEKCKFCSSPIAMTEISLKINEILKENFDYLIFDSITSILMQEKNIALIKFITDLENKSKNAKTKPIFLALKVDDHDLFIQKCCMLTNHNIDLSNFRF